MIAVEMFMTLQLHHINVRTCTYLLTFFTKAYYAVIVTRVMSQYQQNINKTA